MIGGSSERYLLKVVAKNADKYNLLFGTPDKLKKKSTILKEHCNNIGRDHKEIQYSIALPCIISQSEENISEKLSKYKGKD